MFGVVSNIKRPITRQQSSPGKMFVQDITITNSSRHGIGCEKGVGGGVRRKQCKVSDFDL